MTSPSTIRGRIVVVFRNDDPSAMMDLDHERRIFGLFEKYQIPQTIGVIPCVSTGDQHSKIAAPTRSLLDSKKSIQFLKDSVSRTGSEIALHGYCHQTNRLSRPARRDYFEFQRIPLSEQHDLIEKGTSILSNAFDIRPSTFIPPWNRHDRNTILACRSLGYRVISARAYTQNGEDLLGFGTNCCLADFSLAFDLATRSQNQVFIHVLLHSATVRDPYDIRRLESVLKTVHDEPECIAMTISDVVTRWTEEVHWFNQAAIDVVPLAAVEDSLRSRIWPYMKFISHVNGRLPFEQSLRQATDSYWIGDYVDSNSRGKILDAKYAKLLTGLRLLVVLMSFCVVVTAYAIWNLPCDWNASAILGAVTIAILAAGWAASRATSAIQTGKEVFLVVTLTAIGILAGYFGSWLWRC